FAPLEFIVFGFFFFQAEDGIRDFHVTGVQTCALPISIRYSVSARRPTTCPGLTSCSERFPVSSHRGTRRTSWRIHSSRSPNHIRSEERRVGKECRSRWAAQH